MTRTGDFGGWRRRAIHTMGIAALALTTLAVAAVTPVHATAGACDTASSGAVTCTYTADSSGTVPTTTIPVGVTSVTIKAVGAPGGSQDPYAGGNGAVVTTTLALSGQSAVPLYIAVGHAGNGNSTFGCISSPPVDDVGRGGGAGGCFGASGGGASGVYLDAAANAPLVIAGGGGGSSYGDADPGANGGVGADPAANTGRAGPNGGDGGTTPPCAAGAGHGATTSGPGAGGTAAGQGNAGQTGSGGAGGAGANTDLNGYGGGGGGGYYGGGGGGDDFLAACGAGGGAGSSFIVSTFPTGPSNAVVASSNNAYASDTSGAPTVIITYTSPVPSLPQNLLAHPANGAVTITWAPPVSSGGAPLGGYSITTACTASCPSGTGPRRATASSTSATSTLSYTATQLVNGATYTFTVFAFNSYGSGQVATTTTSPAPTAPSAPTSITAGTNGSILTVGWSPPSDDGGSAINSYSVALDDGTPADHQGQTYVVQSPPVSSMSVQFSNLKTNKLYTISVVAINGVGSGPATTSAYRVSVPTVVRVLRIRQSRHAGWTTVRWRMASQVGILGFNLAAGTHRLNTHLIPVHRSRNYVVRVPFSGHAPLSLVIMLKGAVVTQPLRSLLP